MNAEVLQTALLVANGVVIVLLPVLLLWLGGRIKTNVRESTRKALADYSARQQQFLASSAGSSRREPESGLFKEKQQDVYGRLYARYRRASNDFGTMIDRTLEPDFKTFSRDDLLRYLRLHKARERDAADAIAAMDRGDTFAMGRLMTRLHDRLSYRDANTAFNRAKTFGAMNELYLSDAVRQSVANVRESIHAVSVGLMRNDGERRDAKHAPTKDAMETAVSQLLRVMRDELRGTEDSPHVSPPDIRVLPVEAPKPQPMTSGLRARVSQRIQ